MKLETLAQSHMLSQSTIHKALNALAKHGLHELAVSILRCAIECSAPDSLFNACVWSSLMDANKLEVR